MRSAVCSEHGQAKLWDVLSDKKSHSPVLKIRVQIEYTLLKQILMRFGPPLALYLLSQTLRTSSHFAHLHKRYYDSCGLHLFYGRHDWTDK